MRYYVRIEIKIALKSKWIITSACIPPWEINIASCIWIFVITVVFNKDRSEMFNPLNRSSQIPNQKVIKQRNKTTIDLCRAFLTRAEIRTVNRCVHHRWPLLNRKGNSFSCRIVATSYCCIEASICYFYFSLDKVYLHGLWFRIC